MANTIITKNSATTTAVPTSGDLVQGELAVNVTDKRLFTENSGGTVVELGTNPSSIAVTGNATVGGTLGVTGLATLASSTLTANPTLTSGTANGVTYLNGSKVLTSGSALTFDGTNFTTTGSGTLKNLLLTGGTLPAAGNPSIALRSSDNVIYHQAGSANNIVMLDSAQNTMQSIASTAQIWNISNTEQMRLTSTGLGIGTSSPSRQLELSTFISGAPAPSGFAGGALRLSNLTEYESNYGASGGDFLGSIEFYSGDTSAGAGVRTAIKTSIDAYYNNHSLVFYTAPSGTAGILERMRINSSGNVGIGTDSPTQRLTIEGAMNLRNGSRAGAFEIDSSGNLWVGTATTAGSIIFESGHSTTGLPSTGGERARIDSSGNFLLNTTVGYGKFTVQNNAGTGKVMLDNYVSVPTTENVMSIYADASRGYIQSYNNGYKDIAICPSGGNLLVGTTSVTSYIGSTVGALANVQSTNGTNTNAFVHSGTTPYGAFIYYPNAAPNGTINQFLVCQDSSAVRFQLRSNGGLANYSANDVNLSDRREKTNFAPAKSYLETICAIPVQTFNYIDQNLETDDGLTLGVVAQDVQAVAPELVMESNWAGKDEEPKMRLSIYQTDLQYALMKCIQEQQAIIESLKARLDAANL